MTRTRRRIIGLLGIVALLFAQLAVAAHGCQKQAGASVPAAAMSAQQMPCEGMEQAAPVCDNHCAGSEQAQGSHAATFGAFVPAFALDVARPEPVRIDGARTEPALQHPIAPPPSVRYCCFRI